MSRAWLAYEGRRWLWNRWLWFGAALAIAVVAWPPAEQGVPHATRPERVARGAMTFGVLWWGWLAWVGCHFGRRWLTAEAAWVLPTGQTARRACLVAGLASAVATALVLLLGVLGAAFVGDDAWPAWRVHQTAPLEAAPALGPEQRLLAPWPEAWRNRKWKAGDQLSLWVHSTGGGAPTTQASFLAGPGSLLESGLPASLSLEERIDGARRLQTTVPDTEPPTHWAVLNHGPGELGLLARRGLTWLQPESTGRFLTSFGARFFWASVCIAAGALLLGSFLRPWLAFALLGSLIVVAWHGPPSASAYLARDAALWRSGLGPAPWEWGQSSFTWLASLAGVLSMPWLAQRCLASRGGAP